MNGREPRIDVRRAADRFRTELDWLDSRHSFSFGQHYDGGNTHHGLLVVNNDDTVRPGTGFDTHPHQDMEIVTWVLRGALVHQDSEGHSGVIYPGLAQRMSAGTGILHSERNDVRPQAPAEPVRFVQMWVLPDQAGLTPGYQQAEVDEELLGGELVPVASGRGPRAADAAIRINSSDTTLYAARLDPTRSVHLPQAPYLHLFVALGAVELEAEGRLVAGDAARLTDTGGQRITAIEPSELLVWEMHAALGR